MLPGSRLSPSPPWTLEASEFAVPALPGLPRTGSWGASLTPHGPAFPPAAQYSDVGPHLFSPA